MQGLEVKVWRKYEDFIEELSQKFPHERKGIRRFYDECWRVFNSLNSLELKSLEEPRYLLGGGPTLLASVTGSVSLTSVFCTPHSRQHNRPPPSAPIKQSSPNMLKACFMWANLGNHGR